MLNGYYDIDLESNFTPYVGAGLGYTNMKINEKAGDTFSDRKSVFAWQLIGGVSYKCSDMVDVFGEYRYCSDEKPEFEQDAVKIKIEYATQIVNLGVRFNY